MQNIIPNKFKQYLGGFFDGDGSIMLGKQKENSFCLRISFSQSNKDLLENIQIYYPFLKLNIMEKRNEKIEWSLSAAGLQIEPLIDDLLFYSVLKHDQLLQAKKYFPLINKLNLYEQKRLIFEKLFDLKRDDLDDRLDQTIFERVNNIYLSGLFDAEGSIHLNKSLRVKLTQKSSRKILEYIHKKYNCTMKIENYAVQFSAINSKRFLLDIKDTCRYKKPQLEAALNFIDTLNQPLSEEIMEIRENCKNIISFEKTVDINKKNIFFKNKEQHELYIKKCLEDFSTINNNDLILYKKKKEIESKLDSPKNNNKIFTMKDWSNFNIKPKLIFCTTSKLTKLWSYYKSKTSSLPSTTTVGKSIHILVLDEISDLYIGLICLSSDIYSLNDRDKFFNIKDKDLKEKYIDNIMNMSCCVPLQPFGYNTCGGKLLSMLAFSKEIYDYHLQKYKIPLLGISTTSINGKSIQYDRLKELKFVGMTKGKGSMQIPDNLYAVCKEFNNVWDVIQINRVGRFDFINSLISYLQIDSSILNHGCTRGIYCGFIFPKVEFGQLDYNYLKSTDQIYDFWLNRWCNNRITNFIRENKIKYDVKVYNVTDFKTSFIYVLPVVQKTIFTDTLIKQILHFKSRLITLNEIVEYYKETKRLIITSTDISNIFNGKLLPEDINDLEYNYLYDLKKPKKIAHNRKFNDAEIYWVLDQIKSQYSTSKIITDFFPKFKKEISRGTISDINKEKLTPLVERKNIKTTKAIATTEKKVVDNNVKYSKILNTISDEQFLEIIRAKTFHFDNLETWTTENYRTEIKRLFNIIIPRNMISQIWCGELQPPEHIMETKDYKKMLEYQVKRSKPSKFNGEQIQYIISNRNHSPTDNTKLFEKKYPNLTITKQGVSLIIKRYDDIQKLENKWN